MTPDSWRRVLAAGNEPPRTPLALGVELRQRRKQLSSPWAAALVETATGRSLLAAGADVLVGLRPLERSSRSDAWIKGAVSWDAVRRPGHAYDPAHARWFAELYSIGRTVRTLGSFTDASEWLTLDEIESHLLWPHLRAAETWGIPIISTRKTQTVRLADTAELAMVVDRTPTGIDLGVRLSIDGAIVPNDTDAQITDIPPIVRPIGSVGVYTVTTVAERIDVSLAPAHVSGPVRSLLSSVEPVRIPSEDSEEFLTEHLPALARHTAVIASGIEVPGPPHPRLIVTVRFSPNHRVEYSLEWRYGTDTRIAFDDSHSHERDREAEARIRSEVDRIWSESAPVPVSGHGTLTGLDAAEFSTHALPALEMCEDVSVVLRGERPLYRELSADPKVRITTVESADADWFDLGVIVTIDGRTIPFTPLFRALTLGRKRMLLSDGAYFSLKHPSLDRLRELIDEAGGLDEWESGPRINRYQTALWTDFEDLAHEAQPAVSWRATANALRDIEHIESTPVPAALTAELRPYQRAGYEWLAFLWRHRLGGILADDMGLGKTLQMLALIAHTRAQGEAKPVLVVAPTSVLTTWAEEAERFAPGLAVSVIGATRMKRSRSVAEAAVVSDIVVTSYTLLRLDEAEYVAVDWSVIVLDEAQFVKNPHTRAHRVVKDLNAEVTFAVTGTPMENSLSELWALLSLTAPGLFPSARQFREDYIGPIEHGKVPSNVEGGEYRQRRLERLRRRIRPLMLRRTKDLVAADLPEKQEQHVRIELSASHRAIYDTVLQRERQKVLGLLDDLDRNRFIVFRSLTLLRMLSLAPELIDSAHAHIPPSKLSVLYEHLDELLAEGHRTLVFSQFTSFLRLVADRLSEQGIPFAYLDGSTTDRDGAVSSFRSGEAPVFLISLKAGGFGLTLTEADYVFLLDPWWNPAAEAQAVDRAHRIGQTRRVLVYRLIAADTIEEKVMALQQRKARLFRSVMDDDALFSHALTADDIRGLLEP
ncbi:DEAD/DEAH box helicase [Microbacterium sp. C7(2022)]|uniref:DEAD/DEAH box helicase n=1 Tax=Microbacterium sp. C7(2022) TaxID=2992759 RepID=UPI00237BE62D|nr:DEAD/DEAH box helicase [Microbacterium sp. C7(2022)]MDE0545546.1 DEAD/DEAH box helicase [Microbacterium sp. C7(2022)]